MGSISKQFVCRIQVALRIEANVHYFYGESHARLPTEVIPRREWSRWEARDMDEARQGERVGTSESIEANIRNFPGESHVHGVTQTIPGGNRTHI